MNIAVEVLISLFGGGAIAGIMTAWLTHVAKKNERKDKQTDDKASIYKEFSEKYEKRFEKIEDYCHKMERYTVELEMIIYRLDPKCKVPERPKM